MAGFLGVPALVDWLAGKDTYKSGRREEANNNDHSDMIDNAAKSYNWNVGRAKQITVHQAQRELAEHQRKFSEDLDEPEHLVRRLEAVVELSTEIHTIIVL